MRRLLFFLMAIVLAGTALSCQQRGDYQKRRPSPPAPAPIPRQEPQSQRPSAPQLKSEAAASARSQFANKLWKTKLGKMYFNFLYSTNDRENLPDRAGEIVEKVLSDTDHAVGRIAAIQMMNEDLYVKGKIDDDLLARISLLEQEMSNGRKSVEKSTIKTILSQIPFVFLAAIPTGSPVVKEEFRNFVRGHGLRIVAWVRRRERPPVPILQWRRMKNEFLTGYQIGKPFDAFVKTAIPLAIVEWMYTERKIEGDVCHPNHLRQCPTPSALKRTSHNKTGRHR